MVSALNAQLSHHGATDVLRAAFQAVPDIALVSSFGAESVVLLHLTAMIKRDVPVIFIDTEMLFAETLTYQMDVAERLRLSNLRIIRADNITPEDPDGTLHQRDTDACCALRKTRPLQKALKAHTGWITGRKRYQSDRRAALEFFEVEAGSNRIKVNPLARWAPEDVADYMAENRLPRHPLVAQGYPSIGCAPCTSPVADGEAARAGRWRDQNKDECGIHFVNGRMVRTGEQT
ncbi:phosphoadenylyl-sulfate reductase [uncultured Tateyamaria sp.]|uniref:phosphoadenylyl-sulfate reductase n=1 Tax=uncultured Tateyamaria sp. TaxID=455651 RepID=UPI002612E6B0|nr:phosphoadenylyl-sulfate reductase [uncultured Tateyamaria sp.]